MDPVVEIDVMLNELHALIISRVMGNRTAEQVDEYKRLIVSKVRALAKSTDQAA